MRSERVLFVHAHPDDESISTGGWLALLGSSASVVTCTRGERGETVDGSPTAGLGARRSRELAAALAVLGVDDHHWLGGARRRYRDSGMRWGTAGAEPLESVSPDAFTSAPFPEVVDDLLAVVDACRPAVIVSYDERGGYGHPDHVRAGEAARAAAAARSLAFVAIAPNAGAGADADRFVLDVTPVLHLKHSALLAHRSQLVVGDDWFAGANGVREPIAATEGYRPETADGQLDRG